MEPLAAAALDKWECHKVPTLVYAKVSGHVAGLSLNQRNMRTEQSWEGAAKEAPDYDSAWAAAMVLLGPGRVASCALCTWGLDGLKLVVEREFGKRLV